MSNFQLPKNVIVAVLALATSFIVFIYLWSANPNSEKFISEAVYTGSTFRQIKKTRTHPARTIETLSFKLESGKSIFRERKEQMPNLSLGQKVRFTYQKGKFFNNNIYADFEIVP